MKEQLECSEDFRHRLLIRPLKRGRPTNEYLVTFVKKAADSFVSLGGRPTAVMNVDGSNIDGPLLDFWGGFGALPGTLIPDIAPALKADC